MPILPNRGREDVSLSELYWKEYPTNEITAINELSEANLKIMEREVKHIDAVLPPIELDTLCFTLYTANHYGITLIISLNISH